MKTNCFAYNKAAKKCTVLTETVCKKKECSFYKTVQRYEEDKKKYERRW